MNTTNYLLIVGLIAIVAIFAYVYWPAKKKSYKELQVDIISLQRKYEFYVTEYLTTTNQPAECLSRARTAYFNYMKAVEKFNLHPQCKAMVTPDKYFKEI